jgi:glycosyltransferase involved in cell wall biosynthesis
MTAERPLVSIIVRARDEAPALRRLLPIVQAQQTDFPFEIWLLDNDSQDESAQLAREAGICYHHIPRGAFNYATALNDGAALARGEFVVSLSAHCFPQDTNWLAALIQPLRDDPAVVATYGRQWTNPQAAPFEAMGNDTFFPAAGKRPQIVAFSNANSAIRRAYLLLHPFNPMVKILEDHLFFLELAEEYQFVYVPEAFVHHEHERFSWRYLVRRWVREGWAFFFITGHRGMQSPFASRPLLSLRELLIEYPRMVASYAKRGRVREALLTMPFFYLRDVTWAVSFVRAKLQHTLISRHDTSLLLRMNRILLKQVMRGGALAEDVRVSAQFDEIWQLKADWGFIRSNIVEFIRECHDRGLFHSPLLEVGAAGQNDYLAEWYQMVTSNLATNMQGTSAPLDMEDMHGIAEKSLGSVLCSEVIEHVRHPERAIAEAFRVLRPGGTLILSTPYSIMIHNSPDDGGFHGRNFTPQGLELIVREAGFEIVVSETRGQSELRRKLMPSNIFLVARRP